MRVRFHRVERAAAGGAEVGIPWATRAECRVKGGNRLGGATRLQLSHPDAPPPFRPRGVYHNSGAAVGLCVGIMEQLEVRRRAVGRRTIVKAERAQVGLKNAGESEGTRRHTAA